MDRSQRQLDRDARDELAGLHNQVAILKEQIRTQAISILQKDEEILLLKSELVDARREIINSGVALANELHHEQLKIDILRERLRDLPLEDDIMDEFVNDIKTITDMQPGGAPSPQAMGCFSYSTFIDTVNDNLINPRLTSKYKGSLSFVQFIEILLKKLAGRDEDISKHLYSVIISCMCCFNKKLVSTPTYLTM